MKRALLLGALTACGAAQEVRQELAVTVETIRPGIRVYDQGRYVGRSPVTLARPLTRRDLPEGLTRWFVEDVEVFPGGHWTLRLEVFHEGVRVPAEVLVPFAPGVLAATVKAVP